MKFIQKWEGRNVTSAKDDWFSASVPGNIQYDYGIHHNFSDVQYSDNYKQYLPTENDTWEYRTHLDFKAAEGERVFFVCGGIDYRYDISLNDKLIYEYEGMFRSVELDLTDELLGSENILTVKIYPHPKRAGAPAGTRDEADHSAKPPVSYGWDWNPRLLISGIWQDAYIETRGKGYIYEPDVISSLSEDLSRGKVLFSYKSALPCTVHLYDEDGIEVASGTGNELSVNNPELWWCNGQGKPYLYRYEIENGEDSKEGYIGFKTIKLVRNANANGNNSFPKGPYEAPITILLNGRRIFAKGSNWVNPDIFWGNITKERYEELIILAKDANMNIFRMWGGAAVEKNVFYDLCDKYGILVWQEFMLACNNYPDDPHYLSVLKSEATAIIKNLRRHPSLALWCGGNELFNAWSGMTNQSHPLRLLNKLCYELDIERPFLETSPIFGMAHGGYTFFEPSQGGEVFNEFQRSEMTAYTEFGVPSISSVDILNKIIPADELFPPKPSASWVAHHGFFAWGKDRWCCLDTLESYFGKPSSIEDLVNDSNYLQSEGYRGAFEEARRQWPKCSMAINWCYNEPWYTAANNSVLSYPAEPKPCYYYIKEALRPTLFSAKIQKLVWSGEETFEAEIWLLNDSTVTASKNVSIYVSLGEEKIHLLDWSAIAHSGSNTQGPTVRLRLPNLDGVSRIVLSLESDSDTSSTYSFLYKKRGAKFSSREMNKF